MQIALNVHVTVVAFPHEKLALSNKMVKNINGSQKLVLFAITLTPDFHSHSEKYDGDAYNRA